MIRRSRNGSCIPTVEKLGLLACLDTRAAKVRVLVRIGEAIFLRLLRVHLRVPRLFAQDAANVLDRRGGQPARLFQPVGSEQAGVGLDRSAVDEHRGPGPGSAWRA